MKMLLIPHDASSIGACRPRIFFINGFLCFLKDEWQRNGERERERRRHFKEKMSLEEAHHHSRPCIRAWRKKVLKQSDVGSLGRIVLPKVIILLVIFYAIVDKFINFC